MRRNIKEPTPNRITLRNRIVYDGLEIGSMPDKKNTDSFYAFPCPATVSGLVFHLLCIHTQCSGYLRM